MKTPDHSVFRQMKRGVGAGMSGWRGDFLLAMKKPIRQAMELELPVSSVVKRFIVHVIGGDRCVHVEDLLGGLRLIPLDKNPGVRPIGCGEPLLKLVRGAWHRYLAPAIPKAFLPFQFACSLPAGIEALGRDILLEHEEATKVGHHQIFIKRDAKNFYNELDRLAVVHVLKATLDPYFAQYIARVLGVPTVYTLFDAGAIADPSSEQGLLELSTVSGVVQGDVLGFLIGCAVAADAARAWSVTLKSAFPHLRAAFLSVGGKPGRCASSRKTPGDGHSRV